MSIANHKLQCSSYDTTQSQITKWNRYSLEAQYTYTITHCENIFEIYKNRDIDNIKEEVGDTAYAGQMLAAQATGLNLPILGADQQIKKFYDRINIWKKLFSDKGIPFSVDYLKGGSNYGKPDKIRNVFALAGQSLDDDEIVNMANKHNIELEYQPSEIKQASEEVMNKQANQINISRIQNLLSYDHSLLPADRKILLYQLEQAARMSGGGEIDINRIRNAGLGMLFGYVTAKILGFGVPMQMGSAALGGFIGSNSTQSGGKKWDSRGFYHY
jgi:hypothetical protein